MRTGGIFTATAHRRGYRRRVARWELRRSDGSLIGSFSERVVALWIAQGVLDDERGPLIMDTFDDAGAKIAEALVSRRPGYRDQPAKR
jgi:hypothetical protein